jgi:glycerophosphoryl diester phosphodiesterase
MKINNKIIAHRGVHNNKEIPENSLLSFKEALNYNYPIELDVQLTKDNILVVFHDSNLKRMCNKNINIKDINYSDLENINLLNTSEKIPTLKEVLNLINNKVLLDIEVKNTKKITKTCTILLNELSNYNNYILKSFNPYIVRYLKKKDKNHNIGLLIENHYKNKLYNKLLISNTSVKFSKCDFIAINKKLLKNKKIINLIPKYPTLIWTIKSNNEIDYNSNYTYICNNLPY